MLLELWVCFGKIGQPYAYDIINLPFKNDVAVSFITYSIHGTLINQNKRCVFTLKVASHGRKDACVCACVCV